MLETIAKAAEEAGWATTINYDKEKITFTVDIPFSEPISIPSLDCVKIVNEVEKVLCLYTPTMRVAEVLNDDPSVKELLSTTALFEFAEEYEVKLKDLASKLQSLKF